MRMEVVNRIESVIKELWPSADVSASPGSGGLGAHPRPQVERVRWGRFSPFVQLCVCRVTVQWTFEGRRSLQPPWRVCCAIVCIVRSNVESIPVLQDLS